MKVIVSADPIKYPLTGIGRYTYELINKLINIENVDVMMLNGTKISKKFAKSNINKKSKIFPYKNTLKKIKLLITTYENTSSWFQSREIAKYPDYLYHSTNYSIPKNIGASVSTIHDLSVFKWAHCHPKERARFMQVQIVNALKRASIIITDAEYNKNEIAEYFNYDVKKIVSVPLAAGEEFFPRSEEELSNILNENGLIYKKYLLYVGTVEPRKNIEFLLDVYDVLPEIIKRNFPLVIVGHEGWNSQSIHDKVKAAEQKGSVKYLGFASNEDLPLLYSGASIFIYPSLYEGFGLPVLEAMASGVPTICSNCASLPEVAGDAANMYDPTDIDGFKNGILQIIEDEAHKSQAISKGLIQSNLFSWQRCAEETLKVYQLAIESR